MFPTLRFRINRGREVIIRPRAHPRTDLDPHEVINPEQGIVAPKVLDPKRAAISVDGMVFKKEMVPTLRHCWGGSEHGHGNQTLTPSVGMALCIPQNIPTTPKELISAFQPAANSVGIAYQGDTSKLLRSSRGSQLVLSEESTKTVPSACKIRELIVTSAVHAALAATNFSSSPTIASTPLKTIVEG
ncbi:MAG: hypothetical protein M1831_002720 [Alyxoria varia]|nr:MAG: hypothetical protein M1831_002720 [Alyxoria varia]